MRHEKRYFLFACDRCHHPEDVVAFNGDEPAAPTGWRSRGAVDLCPKCAGEAAAAEKLLKEVSQLGVKP